MDRDAGAKPSKALWIPTIWLLINGSRAVSSWLHAESAESLAQQYSEGSPLDAAIYGLLIVAGVVVLNFRSRLVKRFLQENLPLLAFLAYCALSIAWSEYPFIALKRWSKSIGDVVMVMLIDHRCLILCLRSSASLRASHLCCCRFQCSLLSVTRPLEPPLAPRMA